MMTTKVERDDLNGAEHDNEPSHQLKDLQVYKVDLVKRPATGDAFLAVRSADAGGETMPRKAMSVEQFRTQFRPVKPGGSVTIAQRGDPVSSDQNQGQTEAEPVVRQVPSADASQEDKREGQKKRAEKYGIEALEGKGENLSYPSGDPTQESLYGDPVNLKYPLGYDDNEVSLERANNARARFKQAADTYSEEKSKAVIHERIVEAQLKAGASPSYDENDPLDKLLPQSTVDKLTGGAEDQSEETEGTEEMNRAMLERMDKLAEAVNALVIRMAPAPEAEATPAPEAEATPAPEAEATPAPEAPPVAPETAATDADAEAAADDTPADNVATVARMNATLEGVVSTLEGVTRGISAAADAVGAMGTRMADLTNRVGTLAERMDSVERGMTTSNAAPVDETEAESGTVERSALKKSVFDGLLFGGRAGR